MARLLMIPNRIAETAPEAVLPEATLAAARATRHFLVENAKSARAFLKLIGHPVPMAELDIVEIGHRPDVRQIGAWIEPLERGEDIGIISESGCPGIADPGATIAAEVQKRRGRVVPMPGPCSILMALMASGLDGQHFRFLGYLPVKEPMRSRAILEAEKASGRGEGETQLCIETPYRNSQFLGVLARTLRPATRITVATDVSGPDESIRTMAAADWGRLLAQDPAPLPKLPTIFAWLAR